MVAEGVVDMHKYARHLLALTRVMCVVTHSTLACVEMAVAG